MSISIERYVSIASGVIGAQAVAQRELIGMRFTTDPRVPVGSHVVIDNAADALDFFGQTADYDFAAQYFGYTSPAPVSRPEKLRFAAYVDTVRVARVYGKRIYTTLNEFKAVTSGQLTVTLDGVEKTATGITLASATSFADVATAIQTKLVAEFPGTVVTYDAVLAKFQMVTTSSGEVSVGNTPLAELLGWQAGAIFSGGSAIKTPLEAFVDAENLTDSFGSFSFGATLTTEQIIDVAAYNASLNIKYSYYQPVTTSNAASLSAALLNTKSVALILNDTADQYKEAIPAAVMAATNYNRRNATVNYMYRQLSGMTADVTDNSSANIYDALRVNYYGETASAGQKIAFFQRGFMMGGAVDPLDMNVHANEQWMKSRLTSLLLSLQLSLGKIPANSDGRGYVIAQVVDVANQGKFNGTIIVGKPFTTAQIIAITQLTGDPDAWHEVQSKGFWCDARVVERTGESGVTEYVIEYTLCYSKNDVVRKITGSHNLV